MGREKKIIFELDAENSKLRKKLQDVESQLERTGKKGRRTFSGWIKAGITAATAALAGLLFKLREAIGVMSDFDKGMRNVNSILGLNTAQFRAMRDEVLQVQKELGLSSRDLTDALYQAVSAGVDAADAIGFLRVAGKAAVAGVATTTEAVDILTTVLNAFHLDASETNKVADVLFQTIKLGKTTMSELAAAMANVAPIAAANGVALEEVAASIATLTKQGVPTAQAVTQIRAAIIGLNKVLGDGWAANMSLQEAMQLVVKKAGGYQNVLKEMIGRIEGVNAILASTGQNAQTAAADLDAMRNSMGAANDAFQEQSKAIERRWERFTQSFSAGTTKIINGLLDMILPVEKMSEAIEKEQVQLNALVGALADANQDEKLRADIIRQINNLNPNFLKGLDAEKITLEEITARLKTANEEYTKQIALKILNEKRDNVLTQAAEKLLERQKILTDINERYVKVMGAQADMTLSVEEKVKAVNKAYAEQAALDVPGRIHAPGTQALLEYNIATNEYNRLMQEGKKLLQDVSKLQQDLTFTTQSSTQKTATHAKEVKQAIDIISDSIERLQTQLKDIPGEMDQALGAGAETTQEYTDKVMAEMERMRQLAGALGASFTEGFDQEGLKGSLKQMLQTYLSYLENMVLIGEAQGALRAIFGDLSGALQVGIAIALLEAAKIGVASFRSGITNFEGGVAKVHQGEVITNLPKGSNVIPKQQADRLLDITPLLIEIRKLREDVKVLHNPKMVLKGYDIYVTYNRQKRLSMGRN
ncbi:MAG: phage tail tape measure protein [Candidatus Zixiibacteriota bacterium]|nr:MAG: phage tail tape measure protein [candidate division Zixibacteria bacterium]